MNSFDSILGRYKISGAWLLVGLMVIIAVVCEVWDYHELGTLNAEGVTLRAKVTNVVHSRGYNIDLNYYYKNKQYTQSANSTNSYTAGDSVLIKVLPNDLNGKFAIMKKFYSAK